MFENRVILNAVIAGMMLALVFFLFDVVFDLRDHFSEGISYSIDEAIHLVFESGAVLALFFGMVSLFKYNSFLRDQNVKAQTQLSALKLDFDEYVRNQFSKWELTVAEKDVALLLLRGLNTSDIADLRSVSVGTIKVQAHNIFGKSGVSSRVEFMALFMDEFIDIGISK
jgi:DNA-binding NarL/FixJ family response regulator